VPGNDRAVIGARDDRALVGLAAALTIGIGLFFVFGRAPHPWGREGFDCYHDLGLHLARGGPFPTTDVPWGYAYFLAFFYRLAGDRPWVPLVAQVLLNGLVPVFLYVLVRHELGRRIAVIAALLMSVVSLNTLYASTQSSDSVCTVIVLASVALLARALRTGGLGAFVASGALAGLALQFRPNLVLLPAALAAMALVRAGSSKRRAGALLVYLVSAVALLAPWIERNYRLTGDVLPTSTHGGVQLWYGSLETGPYLRSRVGNPKALFEAPPFDYTALAGRSLIVTATTCADDPLDIELAYWTDRDRLERRAAAEASTGGIVVSPSSNSCRSPFDANTASIPLAFTIPGQPNHTVVYYYFRSSNTAGGGVRFTPPRGSDDPFIFFVDDRHLADLDSHHDLIDMFDVVRAMRAVGFGEASDDVAGLQRDRRIDEQGLRSMVNALMVDDGPWPSSADRDVVARVEAARESVSLTFVDGSTFAVPRVWRGLATDVSVSRGLAARLCSARRRIRSLAPGFQGPVADRCLGRIGVNDVFYRSEPHRMRRYTALALDNIRRDPGAFAAAAAYRAVRLFVVQGGSDSGTAVQFEHSALVYRLATIVSASYFLIGVIGAILAVRRYRVWLLMTPLVYVPATICFVLINMRYSVTAQPFLIAFAAVAVNAVLPGDRPR
jgi:Dolichyl-phosphate-mannose-protein mannosyltransferase